MSGLLIGMTRVKKGSIEIAVEMMIQRNVDPSTACRRPQHRIGQLLVDSPAQSGGTIFMNSTWVIGRWVYCWDVPHCNITNLVQVAILITLLLINSSKEKNKGK